MKRFVIVFGCSVLAAHFVAAQKLPHYDLVLFRLSKSADSTWRADSPRFLSAFNRTGYTNQPAFFSSSEIYVTAQLSDDTTQTDIIALDWPSRKLTRVTETRETSEYSPTPMPGGKRFSAVRVEEDGVQRLWSFPLDRSDAGRVEFPKIKGVGYHCWLNDTLAVFFIVGENGNPHSLESAGIKAQKTYKITTNIGRCLVKTGNGRLAFVQKSSEQVWFLKTWNPVNRVIDVLATMPAGTEDFTLLSDGTFICGKGAKLMQFKPGKDTTWREIGDLSKYGIKSVTRITAGRDGMLAVIVQ